MRNGGVFGHRFLVLLPRGFLLIDISGGSALSRPRLAHHAAGANQRSHRLLSIVKPGSSIRNIHAAKGEDRVRQIHCSVNPQVPNAQVDFLHGFHVDAKV